MTSVENLFSNFNDLSKPKTILDTPSDYKKNTETDILKISLHQGSKFKKYQNKIIKKTKPLNNLENPYDTTNLKEGFQGLPNLPKLDLTKNGLTNQSINIIDESDYSGQQGNIDQLRQEYNTTLREYQNLTGKLQGATANFFDRVSPRNPYLNKTVVFTTGHVCYVTNQGVVKYIGTMEIWRSSNIPQQVQINLGIPWQDSYSTPGTSIPTTPPLLSGTFVQLGQSFGNEGENVFVNQVLTNPQDKYIGCYNDKPEDTNILFVPIMNNTNNVSGFGSWCSSIYLNDNRWGAWAGFDRNPNTIWHSEVGSNHNYNGTTGAYIGIWGVPTVMRNGTTQTIMGEYLQITVPNFNSGGAGITLTQYDLQGRQDCCGSPNGRSPNSWYILGWNGTWTEIDRRENQGLDRELRTYNISNPMPWRSYLIIITNCGHPQNRDGQRYCVQISQWNLYTSSNSSFTDADRAMIWNPGAIGYTDFDTCKKYAAENGFTYFGQQDAQSDGRAACLVSNDLARSQRYGEAFNYNTSPLWHSNTTGQNGASAILTTTGSLSVINSSGTSVYSSPLNNSNPPPSDYIGCYVDNSQRTLNPFDGGQRFNIDSCRQMAIDRNFSFFGLQNSTSGNNAQCGLSNDLSQATRLGRATNCTRLANGTWSGGGWSNAIYNTRVPESNFFLILQDDGNMCIYRGTGPNDNQGHIWCSGTNGRQQQPNPNYAASKGIYGRNWISSTSTLAAGQFIGSNNGDTFLIMQTDGNLVLYTSTKRSACNANRNGKMQGGGWVNAIYENTPSGTTVDGGKIGYINENSELREYVSNNVKLGNSYTTVKDFDSAGHDLPGAAYGGASIDQCKSTCNGTPNCYGFAFDNRHNNCFPKGSTMYPYGGVLRNLPGVDTYVREKKPINKPFGISDIVKNIDTVLFRNYIKGTGEDKYHGLSKSTEAEQQKVRELQGKLDTLSSRIAQLSNKFSSHSNSAQTQSKTNTSGLGDYLSDLKSTNEKIQVSNTSMTRILNDSDIVVLQKNYSYLFWTILATGTVLVTMNIAKKQ